MAKGINMTTTLLLVPVWLCWGSFLNVLAYRLVRKQNIAKPRSRCPFCNHQLSWYDNIPVLSWIILKRSMPLLPSPYLYTLSYHRNSYSSYHDMPDHNCAYAVYPGLFYSIFSPYCDYALRS